MGNQKTSIARNIETWPIGKIVPYAKNPRNNDSAVDAIARSISEFGFKVPIIVDKKGVIVAGDARLKAAKSLNLKEVPVIVAADLTAKQIRALRIAENKTSELATWDDDLLSQELTQLQIDEFEIESIGFTIDEIDDLLENADTGSILDDLQNNGFAGALKCRSDTFSVTFNFPVEHQRAFDAFVKEHKKESLELLILREVSSCRAVEAR